MSGQPMRFGICDARVTRDNRRAVDEFARLATASSQRKLKPSEVKRFARLQTQLMRTGVIVLLTKTVVTDHARALYKSLPWWRKLVLRARYYARELRVRLEVWKLRLKS
jgi:hypothetical protein